MTYEQVAELFGKSEKASTWTGRANPERFFFWPRGRNGERSLYLGEDDGVARYLWVHIAEVREYIEPTGQRDSQNIYYRLKSRVPHPSRTLR